MDNNKSTISLTPTYEMQIPPEPAKDWASYEQYLNTEWNNLLNSDPAPSEKEVQTFLEKHPALIPGAFNVRGFRSGHYPWLCGLISQPVLPSYNHRKPDFMWISKNSSEVEPVLIEIEAPGKPWFTKDGQATSKLSQAIKQVAEWKLWFEESHNVEAFKDYYELNNGLLNSRKLNPSYVLVYGRREEMDRNPYFSKLRNEMFPSDVTAMTYDRLSIDRNADQLVCMKVKRDNGNLVREIISVPPTLQWSPSLAKERSQYTGLDTAIEANELIPTSRKEFLTDRLAYWNDWVRLPERGVIRGGDAE